MRQKITIRVQSAYGIIGIIQSVLLMSEQVIDSLIISAVLMS